jgi:hypothetical protein
MTTGFFMTDSHFTTVSDALSRTFMHRHARPRQRVAGEKGRRSPGVKEKLNKISWKGNFLEGKRVSEIEGYLAGI